MEELSSRFNLCRLKISRICRTKLKKSVTFLFVCSYTSKQFTLLNIQIFTHFLKGPHDPKLHAILQKLQNWHCRDGISSSANDCQYLPLVIFTIIAELKMLIVINILSSTIIVKPHTHDQVSLDKCPLDKFYLLVCTA